MRKNNKRENIYFWILVTVFLLFITFVIWKVIFLYDHDDRHFTLDTIPIEKHQIFSDELGISFPKEIVISNAVLDIWGTSGDSLYLKLIINKNDLNNFKKSISFPIEKVSDDEDIEINFDHYSNLGAMWFLIKKDEIDSIYYNDKKHFDIFYMKERENKIVIFIRAESDKGGYSQQLIDLFKNKK